MTESASIQVREILYPSICVIFCHKTCSMKIQLTTRDNHIIIQLDGTCILCMMFGSEPRLTARPLNNNCWIVFFLSSSNPSSNQLNTSIWSKPTHMIYFLFMSIRCIFFPSTICVLQTLLDRVLPVFQQPI